jgi:hypothetical protein
MELGGRQNKTQERCRMRMHEEIIEHEIAPGDFRMGKAVEPTG